MYSGVHKFDNVPSIVNKNRRSFFPNITDKEYNTICKENTEWLEHSSGASIIKYLNNFKQKYKNLKISTRHFLRWQDSIIYSIILNDNEKCNPETIKQICKKYKVYVVSNSSIKHIKYYMKKLNLKFKWFKKVYSNRFFDYDPTKEHYYKKIIDAENIEPGEACVIGDSVENDLQPAKELNIPSYFIDDASKLDSLIKRIINNN